ncbi:MAG TPA: dihydrolipoamide acetyltransferase family protein [Gammaproteobacteria bacterium]|nr:dihydrolipoamide acetyltransferase family protein [Gammaproteobacteria bacterium]
MKIFNLPDLGEGLADAEIVQWHVKEGEMIKVDQPLVSMETAKAVVEVPAPYSGKITKLYGKKGDIIPTHAPLVEFDLGEVRKDPGAVAGKLEVGNEVVGDVLQSVSSKISGVKILPAVRALAKKLNVDLSTLMPTGKDGTITAEDVKSASLSFSEAGPLEPLRGVRRQMALVMQQSHAEVVPVTVLDDADITEWEGKKDYTIRLLKAMIFAAQKEPALNAWYDGQAMGRRVLHQVHIGIAMDTVDGLFLPVIKNAQEKTREALREELEVLKQEVSSRKIVPAKLQGASIILSNFGKFAGKYANPVVVPPTVAILGVGSLRNELRVIEGEPSVRQILPLSLTFDHRAVTGGEATRFLGHLIESLSASN